MRQPLSYSDLILESEFFSERLPQTQSGED